MEKNLEQKNWHDQHGNPLKPAPTYNLEQINIPNPWEMISKPTIDEIIYPNKKLFLLEKWISQIVYNNFVYNKRDPVYCYEMWGLIYEDGSKVEVHSHPYALYSCSYYVDAPKGSAPLIFTTSNRKIKAEEGKLIAFDGRLNHHIPQSKISNNEKRCVIVCNYRLKDHRQN